jgi:phage terminase large subunit-like protein
MTLLRKLPVKKRKKILQKYSDRQLASLKYAWNLFARPNQLAPPGDWRYWFLCMGRGSGKTRSGAEWIIERAKKYPKYRALLVGATLADVRQTMIEEEESSIFNISSPDFMPKYKEGSEKRVLIWPNGARARIFSGDNPNIRGPNSHSVWLDEIVKFKYPAEAFANMDFTCRVGPKPQLCITSTPKNMKVVREILEDPQAVVSTGSTYDNIDNLAKSFIDSMLRKYEGTILGKQELLGQLIKDIKGALWRYKYFRYVEESDLPQFLSVVIGIDPATTVEDEYSNNDPAETGIVCSGLHEEKEKYYVLNDSSGMYEPSGWAEQAIDLYDYWSNYCANVYIVAESNQGGQLVKDNIKTYANIQRLKKLRASDEIPIYTIHAKVGKQPRAQPVSTLYKEGQVYHLNKYAKYEEQLTSWIPGKKSPDRLDAGVYSILGHKLEELATFIGYIPGVSRS